MNFSHTLFQLNPLRIGAHQKILSIVLLAFFLLVCWGKGHAQYYLSDPACDLISGDDFSSYTCTPPPSDCTSGAPFFYDGTTFCICEIPEDPFFPEASGGLDLTCYQFFWDFGDGNHGCGVSPTHTYEFPGSYPVNLIITKKYTDDDDGGPGTNSCVGGTAAGVIKQAVFALPTTSIVVNSADAANTQLPYWGDNFTSCLVQPIQRPHFGEDVWVMVSLPPTTNGTFTFTFDDILFSFGGSNDDYIWSHPDPSPNGTYTEHSFDPHTSGEVEFELTATESSFFLFKLTVTSDDELENLDYSFSVDLVPNPDAPNGSGCSKTYVSTEGIGPKDPNDKTVDKRFIYSDQVETLVYEIEFYNIGTGPAQIITVSDQLDINKLNQGTFQMQWVKLNDVVYPGNSQATIGCDNYLMINGFNPTVSSTGLIQWKFDPSSISMNSNCDPLEVGLNGTAQNGFGFSLPAYQLALVGSSGSPGGSSSVIGNIINPGPSTAGVQDFRTKITLSFYIQTIPDSIPCGETIENKASIQFEELEWFTTSTAKTTKVCCQQSTCNEIVDVNNIFKQELQGVDWVNDSVKVVSTIGGELRELPNTWQMQYDPAYSGADIITIQVCNQNGCETYQKTICVNIDPQDPKFACDSPCPVDCEPKDSRVPIGEILIAIVVIAGLWYVGPKLWRGFVRWRNMLKERMG